MTGTTTVPKASFNYSGSRFSPVMGHVNAGVDHIERPLMTPDEVLRLRPPQKEGGASERIVAPGQMLIFVSGHRPVLGTQMLYFLDPVLKARAGIAPLTELLMVEDGKAVPQKPLPRTQHAISRPETLPDQHEPLTLAEESFFNELKKG
jgi:type IV secretion system protein VirD4